MVASFTSLAKKIAASLAAWQSGRISVVDLHGNLHVASTSDQEICRHCLRSVPQVVQFRALIDDDLSGRSLVRWRVEFDFKLAHIRAVLFPVFLNVSPFPIICGSTSDGSAFSGENAARQNGELAAATLKAELKTTSIDSTGGSHGPVAWNRHSLHPINAFRGSRGRNAVAE